MVINLSKNKKDFDFSFSKKIKSNNYEMNYSYCKRQSCRKSKKEFFMMRYLFLIILIFTLSDCLHNRVTLNPKGSPGQRKEVKGHYFLAGIIPTHKFRSDQFCGENGIYQVHAYTSFFDGCLNCLTISIYSPKTLEIICNNSKTSYRLEQEGEAEKPYYKVFTTNPNEQKYIPGLISLKKEMRK